MRAVAVLPQWKVRVQKCKAVQTVLNLCSPSVTDKCLIAEAWCPVAKLPELQSALREGGVSCTRGDLTRMSEPPRFLTLLHLSPTLSLLSSEEEWKQR